MRRKYIVLLLLASSLMQFARAQDKSNRIRLQSITNIGMLNGGKATSLTVQTILGGSFQNSFIGIGAGMDYYRFRTIPLFADLRHEFGKGKRNIFLYGDIGYNYDCVTEKNKQEEGLYYENINYKGGIYYDTGIGCTFGFKNQDALLICAGYTFKKVRDEAGSGICPLIGPCYNGIETYRYYLSRIVLKAGWRF